MSEELNPASQRATDWLQKFEQALKDRNIEAASDLFADDCYWRDLVAFTWNLKTQEGKAAIVEMLSAQLDNVQPSNFQLTGEATEADGVTESWYTFETGVSRGKGLLRLQGDKCWTLLTSMDELKGFEENNNNRRPMGAEHGIHKNLTFRTTSQQSNI